MPTPQCRRLPFILRTVGKFAMMRKVCPCRVIASAAWSLPRQGHWFSLCCSLATPLGSATAESDFLSSATACAPLISPEEPLMSDFVHLHCHTEYSLLDGRDPHQGSLRPRQGLRYARLRRHRSRQHVRRGPIFTLPARTSASSPYSAARSTSAMITRTKLLRRVNDAIT